MDVNGRQLIRHRNPSAEGYAEVVVLSAEQAVSLRARPEATVRVGDLLPPIEG